MVAGSGPTRPIAARKMRTGKSVSVGCGWSRRCATFCTAGMTRPLLTPAISFSSPCTSPACARAMPRSNSASCCDEISIGIPPVDRCGDGSIPAMFSGTRPDNLGVKDGRFVACKPTPNCGSSQADSADEEHYIAPIAYTGKMMELRRAVESMTRATVIREDGNYLYAEYKSALMG